MPSDKNYPPKSYKTANKEFTEFVIGCMNKYHPFIDDDGRIHLKSQNDGTHIFLMEMLWTLSFFECTDIQNKSYILSDKQIPSEKPWLKNVDEVSGILPFDLTEMFERKCGKDAE